MYRQIAPADLVHNGGHDGQELGREHQSEIARPPKEERAETDCVSHASEASLPFSFQSFSAMADITRE